MRNLFAFLWKFQFVILFFLLEIFSLILLVNSYSYHKSIAYSVTSEFSGKIYSAYSNITDYFSLKQENERLAAENARLRNQLNSSFLISDTLTVFKDSLYRAVPAKVISSSVNRPNNYIMVNKGRKQGVQPEMAVISSDGVVGFVVGVSEHYSYIMSALHKNTRLSASIVKNGQLVNVIWPGPNYRVGKVIDIPSHVHLVEGDTLVTSGNSMIFPQGIVIGTIIEQLESENKGLGNASILFATDFNGLKNVYLIKNLMKTEQEKLIKESTINE
jgi:rod shape-determining protein MreC